MEPQITQSEGGKQQRQRLPSRSDRIKFAVAGLVITSCVNVGLAVFRATEAIDANNAADRPAASATDKAESHKQADSYIEAIERQGEAELGLLALTGLFCYSPATRSERH